MTLREAFGEERDPTVLGLLRVSMAILLILNTARLVLEYRAGGYFGQFFHLPVLIPEAWVPNEAGYVALLALEIGGAALALAGVFAREALLVAALSGLYALCCNRLGFHNNRYALHLIALLTAFTPCDRSFLPFRRRSAGPPAAHAVPSTDTAPTWARYLLRLQVTVIYAASAGGKLLDPDWRGGQVMLLRFGLGVKEWLAAGHSVPGFVARLSESVLVGSVFSKLAIATEFAVGLGLWTARTRAPAMWLGVMFHLGIELTSRVELFSWLMWSSYLVCVTPERRERELVFDPASPAARRWARALRWLDWLERFRVRARAPEDAAAPLQVIDRAGRRSVGLAALAALARAVPLLFPLWVPLLALARLARKRAALPNTAPGSA